MKIGKVREETEEKTGRKIATRGSGKYVRKILPVRGGIGMRALPKTLETKQLQYAIRRKAGRKMLKKKMARVAEKATAKLTMGLIADVSEGVEIAEGGCEISADVAGATCAETEGAGCVVGGAGCAASAVVGVVVTLGKIIGTVADMANMSGTNQYIDQKDMILKMRNQYEGEILNQIKSMPEKTRPKLPRIFNLMTISGLPNLDSVSELKHIQKVYTRAYVMYKGSLIKSLIHTLDQKTLVKYFTTPEDGEPPAIIDELLSAGLLKPNIPERDKFIWDEMSNQHMNPFNINGNDGTYIKYRPNVSAKGYNGITFNKKGTELYNTQIEKTKGKKNSVASLVYTKYYRDLLTDGVKHATKKEQEYELTQMAFIEEVPMPDTVGDIIKTLCTKGLNSDELKQKYPLQHLAHADWAIPEVIKPKDHLVGYDKDTKLCTYDTKDRKWSNSGYCRFMDKQEEPEVLTVPCQGEGCKKSTYMRCKDKDGVSGEVENIFKLLPFGETALVKVSRTVGELENWADDHHFKLFHPSEWF